MEKLYKKEEGKKLCGVCAGLAEYLRMDVDTLRLVWVIVTLCGTIGFWLYVIAALILPWKDTVITEGEKSDEA